MYQNSDDYLWFASLWTSSFWKQLIVYQVPNIKESNNLHKINVIKYLIFCIARAFRSLSHRKQKLHPVTSIFEEHLVLCQRFKAFLYPLTIFFTSFVCGSNGNPLQMTEEKNWAAKCTSSSIDDIVRGASYFSPMRKHCTSLLFLVVLISLTGVSRGIRWLEYIILYTLLVSFMVAKETDSYKESKELKPSQVQKEGGWTVEFPSVMFSVKRSWAQIEI